MTNICVIGGGPAGMIAAGTAASRGLDVTIYEKNEKLGKKMYITGKGRCNITNAGDIDDFMDNIVTNKEFMYSGLYSFSNDSIIYLLESRGIETKVERGNRVFPKTNKSSDVIKGLTKYLRENKVKVKLNSEILSIERKNGRFSILTNEGSSSYDKIIIATGGKSYEITGSTGDGYRFAKAFGHSIVKARPALAPINLRNSDPNLQGLSLKNVELKLVDSKKTLKKLFGEMIFTHFGISGPIVLSMSSFISSLDLSEKDIKLSLDLKPSLSREKLDKRILKDFEENNNKILGNSLDKLLPQKLIRPVIEKSKIDYYKTVHQITREERENLVKALKDFDLNYGGIRSLNEAIITSGGVETNEINPSTMESKLVKGLYFAGETIDVDALTGGYNLQIAYSTGFLAGSNV